jgi:hypothetical protein
MKMIESMSKEIELLIVVAINNEQSKEVYSEFGYFCGLCGRLRQNA